MGKFFASLFGLFLILIIGCYIYYLNTGYSFGVNMTFLSRGSIVVTSPAFLNGEWIPAEYTCDGVNYPPPLKFEHVPTQSAGLVLIVEDESTFPKAFNHWLVFNIPSGDGFGTVELNPVLTIANFGLNDFGNLKYQGPCPSDDKDHLYMFKVYAVDKAFDLDNPSRSELDSAMKGHIITQGTLSGVYSKKP
jgi:Raf kinase inhibitor-like YbhB/YbcL family protein